MYLLSQSPEGRKYPRLLRRAGHHLWCAAVLPRAYPPDGGVTFQTDDKDEDGLKRVSARVSRRNGAALPNFRRRSVLDGS